LIRVAFPLPFGPRIPKNSPPLRSEADALLVGLFSARMALVQVFDLQDRELDYNVFRAGL